MILTVTLNAAIDKRYVVDDFQQGSVNRVKECAYSAGGKGLNVSRVAVISGEEVTATGFVGGHAGNYITEVLEGQKINSEFVHISGESRSCINIYDEVNQTQTEFLEPGVFVTDANKEEMLTKYMELVDKCSVVVISGSVPKGVDSLLYKSMIQLAKHHDKKVILDTSGKLLEESIEAKPTMIKPNMDEIKMLIGKDINNQEELIEAAEKIQKSGIEVVVISCGADGSLIVCNEGVYQAKVPEIKAVNTVGCGDSMIAGFAVGFSRGMSMEENIKFASAVSAANALCMETGFFIKKDMEDLLPKINVIKIK